MAFYPLPELTMSSLNKTDFKFHEFEHYLVKAAVYTTLAISNNTEVNNCYRLCHKLYIEIYVKIKMSFFTASVLFVESCHM